MKLSYLSHLGVALIGFRQQVLAKRGTSSSSPDEESTPDLSPGANLQMPYCYTIPTGPSYGGLYPNPTRSWLHQWVGTYYNGTFKIEIEIADDSEICSNQSGVFMHTYDGVLALAEMPAGVEGGDLSPFIFLLSGWEQGTEPSGNIDALNSYLPNDVIVYMNAITNPRNENWNGSTSWLMEANRQNNGYNFTGLLDDSTSAPSDDSNWEFDIPPCNGSDPSRLDMHPFNEPRVAYDSEADYTRQRNRIDGTFDSSKATVTLMGGFAGRFEDLKSTNGLKLGRYWMTFTGTIDNENSDTLVTTGDSPTWKTNYLLPSTTTTAAAASTTTCVTFNSAISFKSGLGKAVYGLTALAIMITISL